MRKRYALLQTPEFVEEFILDQTLDPAIGEFGLEEVRLIDPTCGSGHFLLGAFRRLLSHWRKTIPLEPIETLARKALDQVYGVDINPYAVAIARFRLVLEVLNALGIKRLERAPDLRPRLAVADSLLHRFEAEEDGRKGQLSFDEASQWGDALFRLENLAEVKQVLARRFHAVVGNPPYITEKDAKKREAYRKSYASASGKYALSAPFTERFFELAVTDGFVGLINSNAWTKRDFGKALIEEVLTKTRPAEESSTPQAATSLDTARRRCCCSDEIAPRREIQSSQFSASAASESSPAIRRRRQSGPRSSRTMTRLDSTGITSLLSTSNGRS